MIFRSYKIFKKTYFSVSPNLQMLYIYGNIHKMYYILKRLQSGQTVVSGFKGSVINSQWLIHHIGLIYSKQQPTSLKCFSSK